MGRSIAVVGLGYVGLPLAVAFGKCQPIIGFDLNPERLHALRAGRDETGEVSEVDLRSARVEFTDDPCALGGADFIIVAVPTPVDAARQPDLSFLIQASVLIGAHLQRGAIVVYESTVYPGVTEEICGPILQKNSGLACGRDFKLGYSPERMNPGDTEHTLGRIVKIVAGMDEESLEIIAEVYSQVTAAGVYRAPNIKTAEAAKVIENTQRDLNIALVNELAMIFHRMGLDTAEVLAAAGTKWNFLPFRPGLVGGHCIGVDPYYLTHKAELLGYHPQVILAGRRINDGMGKYVAEQTVKLLMRRPLRESPPSVTILGLTFKENIPDIRNSKVVDILRELAEYDIITTVCDPHADPAAAKAEYGLNLTPVEQLKPSDAVILAVAHGLFLEPGPPWLRSLIKMPHGIIMDVKSVLNRHDFQDMILWRL